SLPSEESPYPHHLDSQKVSFALSFLKGITLTWFEPDLLDAIPGTEPTWANDYSEFIIELTTNFSPHDPVGNAGYGEGALCHMFYNGLPDCIKDKIARIGKPPGLIDLCTMAQGINMCTGSTSQRLPARTNPTLSPPHLEDLPPSSPIPPLAPPPHLLLAKGRTLSTHPPLPLSPPIPLHLTFQVP
ncbi:hypothetical protein ID866_11261, partial [Astraeus odoratus]